MDKIFLKKILGTALQTALIAGVVFAVVIGAEFYQQKKERESQVSVATLFKKKEDGTLVKVLGEEDQAKGKHQGDLFVAHDIILGGETIIDMTASEAGLIELSHLQGKLYRSSEDDEINYYTSWQTNKSTISSVRYKSDKDVDYSEIKENNFGHNHAIIIPNIDFSSVYQYIIRSKDRWGNEIETGQFVFYTGAPEASFFELLEESFQEVFGWTVGK